MIGTTQKTNYPDTGVCIYAGAQRLSHQYRRILDFGSLADTACHCHRCYGRYYHLPHQETQA